MDRLPTESLAKLGNASEDGQHLEQMEGMRRRCRSECLQMSPIVHHSNGNDFVKTSLPNGDYHCDVGIASNGKRNFAHIAIDHSLQQQQKENIKENISMDHQTDGIKTNDFPDHFRYEKLQLYGDKSANRRQNYLYNLSEEDCDGKDYYDLMSMVTANDFDSQTDIKLMPKPLCDEVSKSMNGHGHGHAKNESRKFLRRTRARSESEHTEFYQVPNYQSNPSEIFRKCSTAAVAAAAAAAAATAVAAANAAASVDSDFQSFRNSSSKQHNQYATTRGKSLSPTKVCSIKKQLINSNGCTLNRSTSSRQIALRKHKLAILKAKQQSIKSAAPMVVLVDCTQPKEVAIASANTNVKGEASDESEYSSLEDDDDVEGDDDSEDELSLTESEDNFHVDCKSSPKLTNRSLATEKIPHHTMLADCVEGRSPKNAPLTSSLFAHVPPYITFVAHDEKKAAMPPAVTKILKWKLTTITPIVIRKILLNSGFRLLKQTNDWMGVWGKHMKSPCFRTLRSYQKMNHIPGTFQIGRKDRIWRNLQSQMSRNGKKEFSFMPHTYILPQDLKRFKRLWPRYEQKNTKWIIKPPASARGTGIKVVNKWTQIPKRKPLIVQKYVDRPLLINGSKFDLRLYVLVTSMNPLRVYMHTDGLARFASVKYSDRPDTLSDRYMHLTNYSINKLSANYTKNEDATSCSGHKWTIKTLWKYLSGQGINTDGLWAAMRDLVLRTILSGEHVINQMSKTNVVSKYNTFELFGIDVILDSELKPWLLEVNISPSLHSSSPLDLFVKGPLVTALLNTVLYQVPPRLNAGQQEEIMAEQGLIGDKLCYDKRLHVTNLSKIERIKHNRFAQKFIVHREQYLDAILENLTPDDIRCLLVTEDELARCAPLERILPTPTSHRYLKFTENPRYYNRLLDAWETRYAKKRQVGIDLLQQYCKNKVHLIVPAQPARSVCKNNESAAEQQCSDEEIEEVFHVQTRKSHPPLEPTKSMDISDTEKSVKILDECKSPISILDEQIQDGSIINV